MHDTPEFNPSLHTYFKHTDLVGIWINDCQNNIIFDCVNDWQTNTDNTKDICTQDQIKTDEIHYYKIVVVSYSICWAILVIYIQIKCVIQQSREHVTLSSNLMSYFMHDDVGFSTLSL